MKAYTVYLDEREAAALESLARKGGALRPEVIIAEAAVSLVHDCANDEVLRHVMLEHVGDRQREDELIAAGKRKRHGQRK